MAIHNILVPVDFSKNSEVAIEHACDFASKLSATVHLVHVLDAHADADAMRAAEERLLSVVKPSVEGSIEVRREVLRGVLEEQLGEYSHCHAVDFIVMGTRSHGRFSQHTIGKHVERVVANVSRPVMIIRTDLSPDRPRLTEVDELYERIRVSDMPGVDLIARAASLRATDVHIDPTARGEYGVRLRIDGQLSHYCSLSKSVAEHLIHQLLVLARLDQATPFKAREGRLYLPEGMTNLEVRITSSPVDGGEAVSLRIFSPDRVDLSVNCLGFSEYSLGVVNRLIRRANGLVLVTGPTGSGKTTTVYSILSAFQQQNLNIISIEDPVEFNVPFVRQMSVDVQHGQTMTSGLKTTLRMDPDIISIGEIRDAEAAMIAISAANAGRFVISSMHTRDAASTITALRDLSVDDRSLTGNLAGIINQRLVRRLCRHCRASRVPTQREAEHFAQQHLDAPEQVFYQVGCDQCMKTGYFGRCGVFETVELTDGAFEAIAHHRPEQTVRAVLRESGVPSLSYDALLKVREGITSFEEIQSISWL